jgi:hypothetical protein
LRILYGNVWSWFRLAFILTRIQFPNSNSVWDAPCRFSTAKRKFNNPQRWCEFFYNRTFTLRFLYLYIPYPVPICTCEYVPYEIMYFLGDQQIPVNQIQNFKWIQKNSDLTYCDVLYRHSIKLLMQYYEGQHFYSKLPSFYLIGRA